MGLGSFLRKTVSKAPGMDKLNKLPGMGGQGQGGGRGWGGLQQSDPNFSAFKNPMGDRARQYSQTGVIPPLKQAFGRGPTELPLGGQGIAGMQRPWQPGGIGNQPGQPPMGASMNPPQLNRTAVMPPGYQSQGQSNPAWQNPSLPWDPQQGQGGGGPMRIQGPVPQMNPVWGQPRPQMPFPQRQNFGKGMEREQRPYPNPAWGGGGSPVQQQPPGQMPLPGPQGRGIFF